MHEPVFSSLMIEPHNHAFDEVILPWLRTMQAMRPAAGTTWLMWATELAERVYRLEHAVSAVHSDVERVKGTNAWNASRALVPTTDEGCQPDPDCTKRPWLFYLQVTSPTQPEGCDKPPSHDYAATTPRELADAVVRQGVHRLWLRYRRSEHNLERAKRLVRPLENGGWGFYPSSEELAEEQALKTLADVADALDEKGMPQLHHDMRGWEARLLSNKNVITETDADPVKACEKLITGMMTAANDKLAMHRRAYSQIRELVVQV